MAEYTAVFEEKHCSGKSEEWKIKFAPNVLIHLPDSRNRLEAEEAAQVLAKHMFRYTLIRVDEALEMEA